MTEFVGLSCIRAVYVGRAGAGISYNIACRRALEARVVV
jgi:hypothetical protein